jgi:hypothetical protein
MTASRSRPHIRHEAACRRPCTGWFQRHQPGGFPHAEALHFRTPCTACLHLLHGVSIYTGQKVEWLQPRWSADRNYVEIRVRILQNGESPVPVAYRL